MSMSISAWVRNKLVTTGVLRYFPLEKRKLEIAEDGSVNLVTETLERDHNSIWPKFHLVRDTLPISLKHFYSLLDANVFGTQFRNASIRFSRRIKGMFSLAHKQALTAALQSSVAVFQSDFDKGNFWTENPEFADNIKNSEKLLQIAIDEALTKYQSEVLSEISTITSSLVGNIVKNSMKEIEGLLDENAKFNNKLGSEDAYPDGVKFVFTHGKTRVLVFEQKPGVYPISFVGSTRVGGRYKENVAAKRFNLSFPYIIFAIVMNGKNISKIRVAYSTSTIEKLDQMLLRCNMPNVSSGFLCIGNIVKSHSVLEAVKSVQAAFFGNDFNNDWVANYYDVTYKGKRYKTLNAWEELSKNVPQFALDAQWQTQGNLKDFIIGACDEPKIFGPDTVSSEGFKQIVSNLEIKVIAALNSGLPSYLKDNVQARGKYRRSIAEKLSTELSQLSQQLLKKLVLYIGTFVKTVAPPQELESLQKIFMEQLKDSYVKAFAEVAKALTFKEADVDPKPFRLQELIDARHSVIKPFGPREVSEEGRIKDEYRGKAVS